MDFLIPKCFANFVIKLKLGLITLVHAIKIPQRPNLIFMPRKCVIKVKDVFGRLTVLSLMGKKPSGKKIFLCSCQCGNIKSVVGVNLTKGITKSCGCLNKEWLTKKNTKPEGVSSFMKLYRRYRDNSKSRGYDFNLTVEEFISLTEQNCSYCGAAPKKFNVYDEYKKTPPPNVKERANILANGIDRIDNSLGYVINNCAPCCTDCNTAKMSRSVVEFLTHAQKIVEFSFRTAILPSL